MNRETLAKSETSNFMKISQTFSRCYMKTVGQINKGTETHFCSYLPELTVSVATCMYRAADCCLQIETVPVITVQHTYCTYYTLCNWTVLTQKLLLRVQLHNSRETVQVMSSEVECGRSLILYLYRQTIISSDQILQRNSVSWHRNVTISQRYAPHMRSYQATVCIVTQDVPWFMCGNSCDYDVVIQICGVMRWRSCRHFNTRQ